MLFSYQKDGTSLYFIIDYDYYEAHSLTLEPEFWHPRSGYLDFFIEK